VAGPDDAIIAAMMSIGRLMKTRLGDGIDPGTYHLLHALHGTGAVRVTDLAAACRLDTSTVSRHVAGLERNGLVARRPHPDDGRAQAVDLTERGRRTLEQANHARKQLVTDLLADWPAEDVADLTRLLTVFAAHAEAKRSELADPRASSTSPAHSPASDLTTASTDPELEHV